MKRSALIALTVSLFTALAAPAALAQTPGGPPPRAGTAGSRQPAALKGVKIDEKLGAQVPRDVMLRDQTGAPVAIGSFFDGHRPVLLTFYYSNCPMLCSVLLGDLVDVLNKSPWVVGDKFRIVSISMDPTETPKKAFKTREGYLDRYKAPHVSKEERFTRVEKAMGDGKDDVVARFKKLDLGQGDDSGAEEVDGRSAIEEGWTFLVGKKEAVRKIADTVGFHYNYIESKKQYAHPTAIIVLSGTGKVVSYIHGLSYEPKDLTSRVVKAALNEPTESTAQYLYSCFHFEEPTGFAAVAFKAMRYGGFVFVAFLFGGLFLLHIRKRYGGDDAASESSHRVRPPRSNA